MALRVDYDKRDRGPIVGRRLQMGVVYAPVMPPSTMNAVAVM
jgi:hypothetical protein